MNLAKIIAGKHNPNVIYSVPADMAIKDAAKKMFELKIGSLMVTEPEKPEKYAGIITERDIIRFCCSECDSRETTVEKFMARDMIVATVEDDAEKILGVMTRHKFRHLPVINKEKIIAVISMSDIISAFHAEDEIRIHRLSDFIGGTYGGQAF